MGLVKEPKLGDVRKLRGIYYLDPEDMEFKNTMKKCAQEMVEVPLASAMPCNIADGHEETLCAKDNSLKKKKDIHVLD